MQIVPPILPTLEITWLQTDASACARKFISRENNMGGENDALRANWSDELRENVSTCNPIQVSWSTFNYVHWDEDSFHSLGFLMWPLSLPQRYYQFTEKQISIKCTITLNFIYNFLTLYYNCFMGLLSLIHIMISCEYLMWQTPYKTCQQCKNF